MLGDFWDGSRTFPLVVGAYTAILMLLALGIIISRGGTTGEYAVKVLLSCELPGGIVLLSSLINAVSES